MRKLKPSRDKPSAQDHKDNKQQRQDLNSGSCNVDIESSGPDLRIKLLLEK